MRFPPLLFAAGVMAAVLAGCGDDDASRSDTGPLALDDPDGYGMAAFAGTLRVTEDCTFLRGRSGTDAALSWPVDQTTWNNGQIHFTRSDGEVVTLVNGDVVELGGAGDSRVESGRTNEEWLIHGGWVVAPKPSCARERRIAVGDVEKRPATSRRVGAPGVVSDAVGVGE